MVSIGMPRKIATGYSSIRGFDITSPSRARGRHIQQRTLTLHRVRALGQLMPIGATGYLVRSLSFFDGAGAARLWTVLCCWIAFGLTLLAFDSSKERLPSCPGLRIR